MRVSMGRRAEYGGRGWKVYLFGESAMLFST